MNNEINIFIITILLNFVLDSKDYENIIIFILHIKEYNQIHGLSIMKYALVDYFRSDISLSNDIDFKL